ncbi:MAG: hypothetical protein ACOVLB_02410, partial [Candidatus Nanopelagicus sp.]
MAKKNASQCAKDAIFSGITVLPETAMPIAKGYLEDMQKLLTIDKQGAPLSEGDVNELIQRLESMGMAALYAGKKIQEVKTQPNKFTSAGRVVAADGKANIGMRDTRIEGLITHYDMAAAQSDLIGLVVGKTKGKVTDTSIDDFIARASLQEATLRAMHIPIVVNKPMAASVSGPLHYAHVSMGDIGRVFHRAESKEVLSKAIFNSREATENIQFQNIAEAARRIIEANGTKSLEDLQATVREALTTKTGSPVNKQNATKLNLAMKWASSPAAAKIVDDMVESMTDPKFIEEIIAENNRMLMVNLAMSQADGWLITSKILETVADLTHRGQKLRGWGAILYKNGVREAFQSDALVKMQPDNLTMGFSENAVAKFFAAIDEVSHAVVKETHLYDAGIAKDAAAAAKGKKTRAGRNGGKEQVAKDISDAAAKIVDQEFETDPFVKYMAASEEESKIARKFELELQYGSVVGGLAKIIGKVSDLSTMGSEIKTTLMGVEHRR